MWVLTVCSLMISSLAISPLERPGGEQLEHLRLARCQIVGQLVGERRPGPLRGRAACEQHRRDLGRENRVARGRAVQRLGDLAAIGVLGQVAARPRLQRGDDRLVVGVGGEHDDCHFGMLAIQPLGRADSVEHRHVEVEQDRVGLVLARPRRAPVRRRRRRPRPRVRGSRRAPSAALRERRSGRRRSRSADVLGAPRHVAHRVTRACTTQRLPTGPT